MSPESPLSQEPLLDRDDVPTNAVMRLAEQGGAFDFRLEEGEDLYSILDGEAL